MNREEVINGVKKAECIEREAAIQAASIWNGDEGTEAWIQSALQKLPAADVCPVVRGKWVQVMGKYDWMVKCSRCNYVPIETSNFCPNCGAYMREES